MLIFAPSVLDCVPIVGGWVANRPDPNTNTHESDLMRTLEQSDGHDAPWLGNELPAGVAALLEDVSVELEDPVFKPVVTENIPEVLIDIEG